MVIVEGKLFFSKFKILFHLFLSSSDDLTKLNDSWLVVAKPDKLTGTIIDSIELDEFVTHHFFKFKISEPETVPFELS